MCIRCTRVTFSNNDATRAIPCQIIYFRSISLLKKKRELDSDVNSSLAAITGLYYMLECRQLENDLILATSAPVHVTDCTAMREAAACKRVVQHIDMFCHELMNYLYFTSMHNKLLFHSFMRDGHLIISRFPTAPAGTFQECVSFSPFGGGCPASADAWMASYDFPQQCSTVMRRQRTAWVCGVVGIVLGCLYIFITALLGSSDKVPGGWRCVMAVELVLVLQIIALISVCVIWFMLLESVKEDYIHISTISGWERFPNSHGVPIADNDMPMDDTTDDGYAGWDSELYSGDNEGMMPRFMRDLTLGFPKVGAVGSGITLFVAGLVMASVTLIVGLVAAARSMIAEPELMYSRRASVYRQVSLNVADGIYE